ncbi:MAG: BamA/TamA family outer membrane protein [Bacteroidetes bacterium]|nr:BamA/TamA family outer membrane protein [Bacteroidota bacterium]
MNRFFSFRFFFSLFFCLIRFASNCHPETPCSQVPDLVKESLADTIIINQISISGNSITKRGIILRELDFKVHDTLSLTQFSKTLTSSRQYIWPIPYFEISDRNFNVWYETRDFSHLTYGFDLTFSNVRGRNETLKILTHFGFNQKYGFMYRIPYINHKQTMGTGFGAAIELNHELPVFTLNNQPVFIRNNVKYLKKLITGFAELNLRPDIFSTHTFRLAYSYHDFDSSICAIPGYTLSGQTVQRFFSFTYLYKNDHRDVQYYPLQGYCVDIEMNHSVPYQTTHNTFARVNLRVYSQIISKWYWASGFTGKLCFEKIQPYYLQRGLGYGRDYVRGYEYYVIDGQHFILLKNNLKFALMPQRVQKIGLISSEKFNAIPYALYLNGFIDLGYVFNYPENPPPVHDAGNTLENRFLFGYGLGLDFTTYYDIVIRVEAALNLLLEPGIYLHFIAPI